MSSRAVDWAYRQDLGTSTKFVLVAMADECGVDDFCFASRGHLAYKTDLTESYVFAALGELASLALVVSAGRLCTPDGEEMDDVYYLNVDNTSELDGTPVLKPPWDASCETQNWDADRARMERRQ